MYNVSIKCHVHKLCSTRHHMLFRIFLNNQYSDDSLPFYSKKLFKEKLLVREIKYIEKSLNESSRSEYIYI